MSKSNTLSTTNVYHIIQLKLVKSTVNTSLNKQNKQHDKQFTIYQQ